MKKIVILGFIFFSFVSLFAQKAGPNDGRVFDREFYNAEKLFFQKKYNFAREAFLLYLKRRPLSTNDMLYYYIGASYFQDKQYEKAIEYYKLAFDINDSYSFCNNIANSYYQLKNYNDALIWYNRSIERLHSPYIATITNSLLTNYIVSQNVVTNTIFVTDNNNSTDDITNITISSNSFISNENITNVVVTDNTNDIITSSTNTENITSAINIQNEVNKEVKSRVDNLFTKLPLFSEVVITNTFTNANIFTNTTVIFENNPNFALSTVGGIEAKTNSVFSPTVNSNTIVAMNNSTVFSTNTNAVGSVYTTIETNGYAVTNIIIRTNIINNGTNVSIQTNVASVDMYNTWALYYSAYLNRGHTYLALKDYTNAAISYEIFLTNVGNDYYQKESLEKVINLIRSNDTSIQFIPFTNNFRVSTNNDGSITKETIYPNFDYERDTLYTNGVRIVYESSKNDKTTLYSNDYQLSDTQYFYGKREIETKFENGDKKIESYFSDNSKVINTKTANGDIYEYTLYPDGSFINRKILDNNNTFVVERSDGSITTNYRDENGTFFYSRSLDGTEVKKNKKNNGETITETRRVDGVYIIKKEAPDGSYEIVANYIDGSIGTTTVDTNGNSRLKVVYPDGRVEERASNGVGAGQFSYNVKADDGSIITKTYNDDGSFTVVTKKVDGTVITDTVAEDTISEIKMPNGTTIKRIIRQDGSRETTTLHRDSTSITEVVASDGSSKTTTVKPDGSTTIENKDSRGNSETIFTDRQGNKITTNTYIDGRVVSLEERIDGTVISIESDGENKHTKATDYEGYVLEIKQIRNDDAVITLLSPLGERVDINTARDVVKKMRISINADSISNLLEEQGSTNISTDTSTTEDNTIIENTVPTDDINNTTEEN